MWLVDCWELRHVVNPLHAGDDGMRSPDDCVERKLLRTPTSKPIDGASVCVADSRYRKRGVVGEEHKA